MILKYKRRQFPKIVENVSKNTDLNTVLTSTVLYDLGTLPFQDDEVVLELRSGPSGFCLNIEQTLHATQYDKNGIIERAYILNSFYLFTLF